MRTRTSVAAWGLMALLMAGCGGRSGGGYSGTWAVDGTRKSISKIAERSFPANAEELKQAITGFLAKPFSGNVRDPNFLAISEPIQIKQNEGTVLGYWVQYTATDSYGNTMLRNHDLFLMKDGNVIAWYRTTEEVRERLGTRWVDEHAPPPWPDVVGAKKQKA